MAENFDVSHDVNSALNRNAPVVALESSLIAHGLPAKTNVETALAMEENVRAAGAVPATIGVIDGRIKIGLSTEEIERLGEGNAAKLAVRDVAYAVCKRLDGGATVSATARIASAVGIAVMATGGIGGVHRRFGETLDISADLWELARTPIVVVCSGAKAVLDIPATLEWLETHSVPVYGYATDDFPAFFSRTSGLPIPSLDGACDCAETMKTGAGAMGFRSAVIIAAPIPKQDEIDVSAQIEQAETDAAKAGITGKALTPYLLNKVAELTQGKSLAANVALLKNNATVAAEIAVALTDSTRRRMGFTI